MNLRSFLDQDVLVQFRGPWHMVIAAPNGQPTIALTRTPPPQRDRDKVSLVQLAGPPVAPEAPQAVPLVVPIAQGRFVDIGGDLFFSYVPEPITQDGNGVRHGNDRRIDVQFHPDAIFSVSKVRPEPLAST